MSSKVTILKSKTLLFIIRLVNNAIMGAVPNREHAGAATEGFC